MATQDTRNEDLVFLSIRLPRTIKKRVQQAALDEDTTIQAIVRQALEHELDRLAPPGHQRSRRR